MKLIKLLKNIFSNEINPRCTFLDYFFEKDILKIKFLETEYNGRKTTNTEDLLEIILNDSVYKNFSKNDKIRLLSIAFEERLRLGIFRYAIERIILNECSTIVRLFDKTLPNKKNVISINLIALVENNECNILENLSRNDLKRVFYYFNEIKSMETDDAIRKIQENKKSTENKNLVFFRDVKNAKNKSNSRLSSTNGF